MSTRGNAMARRWSGAPDRRSVGARTVWMALLLVAPAMALVRALRTGWQPEGDDATIVLRAREVFHGELPLQGMRSTAGGGDPSLANHHLGALELHLLMPASWWGSGWAVALTCVLVAAVCSLAVAHWAHRIGGDPGLIVFGSGMLVLQWAIGPAAMFRPFNPYIGLLPVYLALLLLTARLRRLPGVGWPLILTTGLIAQSNLAFAPIGLGIAAWCLGLTVTRLVREHPGPGVWRRHLRARPRRVPRAVLVTAGVALLVWGPVVVEPLRHDPGNLGQLLKALLADTPSQGPAWALSRLGLMAPVPGGFRTLGLTLVYGTTAFAQGAGWVLLVALAIGALPVGLARRRPIAAVPTRAAVIGMGLTLTTLMLLPRDGLANHYLAAVIPTAIFSWAAVTWWALLHWSEVRRRLPGWQSLRIAASASVVAAVLALVAPMTDATGPDLGRRASHLVTSSTSDLPAGSHVEIYGSGFLAAMSTAPAVALGLEREDLRAHYLHPWPTSEDAGRLARPTAPSGSTQVYLIGGDVEDRTPPTGAQQIGTVRDGPEQFVDVYLVRGAQR